MHCHLDLYKNPGRVIAEADKRGIYVIAVTTTPKAFLGNLRLTEGRKRIRVAVGLHPELVFDRHREVDEVCKFMSRTKYVGEIGIDGSPPHAESIELQKKVFAAILEHANKLGGRILSIHSRGAASAVLDQLETHCGTSTPILHWFTGTQKEMERASALGCWFSVGPAMLRSRKGRELAKAVPRARLLIETDGPFAMDGDNPLMPWDAGNAIPIMAELWNTSPPDAANAIYVSFQNMVRSTDFQVER